MSTMLTFFFFSVVFLAIGIILYVMSDQITEIEMRYDNTCESTLNTGNKCEVTFKVEDAAIKQPIYLYYQLDNFYQNHRRYVKSRDNSQLAGSYLTVDKLSDCDPIVKIRDLSPDQQKNLDSEPFTDS